MTSQSPGQTECSHLEQSQGQVVQLLLLTESDEELLAQLGVEKDLFFFELQFWLSSVGPDRGTEGGDVVTDIVNTGLLNMTSACEEQNRKLRKILPAGVSDHQGGDFSCHTFRQQSRDLPIF